MAVSPWFESGSHVTPGRDDRFWVHHPSPTDQLLRTPFYVARCGYSLWGKGRSWTWESSPVFGIELITAGELRYTQDGRSFSLSAGDAFVCQPGTRQSFGVGKAAFAHKRYVYFAGPMVEMLAHATGIGALDRVVGAGARSQVCQLIKQACRLMAGRAGEAEKTRELSVLALRIALEVAGCVPERKLPDVVLGTMEHMNRNLTRRVTLRGLAQEAGVSTYHLNHLFARHAGTPPLRYLTRRRMAYAAQLLSSTNLLIKEIAAMVGYDNPLHFSGVFSKTMGSGPRRYRAMHPSSMAIDEERRTRYL